MVNGLIVTAGRSGEEFKKRVVRSLIEGYNLSRDIDGGVDAADFNNGELSLRIGNNQARKSVHHFQSFNDPNTDGLVAKILESNIDDDSKTEILKRCLTLNRDFMELLTFGDAVKRASPSEVFVYSPFFPYGRQDRKSKGREPITAKLVFDLVEAAYGKKLEAINIAELHAPQEQGFSNEPVRTVPMFPFYVMAIKYLFDLDKIVIVSPDAGGVTRAREVAKLIGAPMAYIDKRRPSPGVAEAEYVVGDVEGKTPVIIDDIADSCGSLVKTREILIKFGALDNMHAFVTYALMTISYGKDGKRRIAEDVIKEAGIKMITTNCIPRTMGYYAEHGDLFTAVIDMSDVFADLVYCNHTGNSFTDKIKEYVESATHFDSKNSIQRNKFERMLLWPAQ